MKKLIALLLLPAFMLAMQVMPRPEKHPEYEKYFRERGLKGSFGFFDVKQGIYKCYDCYMNDSQSSPGSTFKIMNSLIALETGVAKDENFVLKWDGKDRGRPEWNKDQDMKTAFSNSTVWYYQELARRIGEKRMKELVRKSQYGNGDLRGGIDSFWLTGKLYITPKQQVDFLRRLYLGQLPFSKRSMDITKKIMLKEKTDKYILRGKTGWVEKDNYDIGWFVGWVEQNGSAYIFATRIFDDNKENKGFAQARIDITKDILQKELGLL